jgi:hypothetical protein
MKLIYFDIDNPELIDWLKTRPTDSYKVLLGSDRPEDSVDVVFAKVTKEGVPLVQWLIKKLQSGEMQLRVNTKIGLPQGVEVESAMSTPL